MYYMCFLCVIPVFLVCIFMQYLWKIQGFIPIFHCDAKTFTLGPGVGLDPQCHNFALGIPTSWYLKTAKICIIPTVKHKICVTPKAKPQCEPMEYRLHWVPNTQFLRISHVHFMLFVLISFALVTQREPSLQWNMGFSFYFMSKNFWSFGHHANIDMKFRFLSKLPDL